MIDYHVFMLDLPARVHGITVLNEDDSYTIFINDSLSPTAKRNALRHEVRHIKEHDFERTIRVQDIELIAHVGERL